MKARGIITLGLIGALSIGGGAGAYAQMSKDAVPKNVVMTETQVSNKEDKKAEAYEAFKKAEADREAETLKKAEPYKKAALDAFKKYFNVDVTQNSNGLEFTAWDNSSEWHDFAVAWLDKSNPHGSTMVYDAIIDTTTNKITRLACFPETPKNEDYQNLSCDTAKDIADKFVKDNNFFDNEKYEFLNKESSKANSSLGKKSLVYVFYYKCNGEKWSVVVNKDLKKVSLFMFDNAPEGSLG